MPTIIGFVLLASSALQPQYAQAEVKPASFPVSGYSTTTEGLIARYASEFGVSETQMAQTIQCESQGFSGAIGDHGMSYGIAQIHLPAHPDISKEEALNKEWSIRWMAQQFSLNKQQMWSCWRSIYGYQ